MNEYGIMNMKTGDRTVIFGYTLEDAARRWHVNMNDWAVLYYEYVD